MRSTVWNLHAERLRHCRLNNLGCLNKGHSMGEAFVLVRGSFAFGFQGTGLVL
jgi:hypothetical protein